MKESALQVLKKITRRAIVRCTPKDMSDAIFSLKHRNTWKKDDHSHLQYQEQYRGREPVILELQQLLNENGCDRPRILEFGCSGANVLLLIKEYFLNHTYCGIDANERAIQFAREKFPNDTFHVCDDIGLPKLMAQLGRQDVFLALAVLYYINSKSVQEILINAGKMAEYVVVLDDLRCFNLPSGKNDGLFFHSFSNMCRKAGLEIIVGPIYSKGPRKTEGFFIARSSAKAESATARSLLNISSLEFDRGNIN